jgi:hypothetical protein
MTQGPSENGLPVRPDGKETVIRKTVGSYSYERTVYQVQQEFSQLDPQAIGDACNGWKRAADELFMLADDLKSQIAVPLNAAWSSPASPAAQQQLQVAEATARALANDCMQMAHATDYAARYAEWYQKNLPSYAEAIGSSVKGMVTSGPSGASAGAEAAVTHMANLLNRYNEVIQILPSSVRASLVTVTPGQDVNIIDGGGSGSGVGSTHAPSIGADGSGAPGAGHSSVPASGVSPGGHSISAPGLGSDTGSTFGPGSGSATSGLGSGGAADPYTAGSSLAGSGLGGGLSGFDSNTLGSAGSGVGGAGGLGAGPGAGLLGAGGLGAGGLASGVGVGGLGAGRPGAGVGGVGSLAGQATGGPAGVRGLGGPWAGASGEGVGARSGGMLPLNGAGGHGEGEEERERSTWLMEDDDVWGTGGDAPPPVITG